MKNILTTKYQCRKTPGSYSNVRQLDLSKVDFDPYPEHQWDIKNYQIFTDFANIHRYAGRTRIRANRFDGTWPIPDWVKAERTKYFGGVCPAYTHTSGKLFSKFKLRPPFLINAVTETPIITGAVPSIWLRNDLKEVTREIDLFETNTECVFFTGHVGFANYEQTKFDMTPLYVKPVGYQQVQVEVLPDRVDWWFNGVHVKTMRADWDYEYYVIISLGVTHPSVKDCYFDVQSVTVWQ